MKWQELRKGRGDHGWHGFHGWRGKGGGLKTIAGKQEMAGIQEGAGTTTDGTDVTDGEGCSRQPRDIPDAWRRRPSKSHAPNPVNPEKSC